MQRSLVRINRIWKAALATGGIAAALLAGLVVYLRTSLDWIDHTDQVIAQARLIEKLVADGEMAERGYLLTRDRRYLQPLEAATPRLGPELERLERLVADNPSQQVAAREVAAAAREVARIQNASVEAGGSALLASQQATLLSLRDRLARFVAVEESLRTLRSAHARRTSHVVLWSAALLTLLLAGAIGRFGRATAHRLSLRYEELLAARERTERLFRDTFELAAVGIAHVGQDGRWLRTNRRLAELLGYTRAELSHLDFRAVTHPDDLPLDLAQRTELWQGRAESVVFEKRYQRKDGSVLWGMLTLSVARTPEGAPDYLIAVVQDIGARKEAEDQLRGLTVTLEERVKARTAELESFSYSVSHDLRAPLRAIDGFSELLTAKEAQLDEEGRDLLHRIRRAAVRMGQLIDDLLALSRLSRAELSPQSVDLSALAAEVARDLQERGKGKAEVQVQPGLAACADPRLLRVLLENLIGNALKFTGKVPAPRVEVGREGEAFFVRDNGAGFAPEYASRLFQPFQRLHRDAEFEGNGIGLATVQRIVSRHGGTVRAEGRRGAGARFLFTLPASR